MTTQIERKVPYFLPLLASITQTAAATGNTQTVQTIATVPVAPVKIKDPTGCIAFILDVSAAATLVGDTLNVYVQTLIDGTHWVDVAAFTLVVGNGGAQRIVAKISASAAQAMFENGASLAAGSVRNLIGDQWAVRWSLAGTGSFTFSVTADPG